MAPSRRQLLHAGLALCVVGCAPAPVDAARFSALSATLLGRTPDPTDAAALFAAFTGAGAGDTLLALEAAVAREGASYPGADVIVRAWYTGQVGGAQVLPFARTLGWVAVGYTTRPGACRPNSWAEIPPSRP